MSLGNSNMAGNALEVAFYPLLLVSVIQGLQDVELPHHEAVEAVVGQNITLPCFVNSSGDFNIVNIAWSKRKNQFSMLAVYNPLYGNHEFWPNVTIQLLKNDADKLVGSYLHLPEVNKWDSGIYICETLIFAQRSKRTETELTIRDDVKIACDVDGTVEVHNGENVTIHCRELPNAQYRWTKNEKLVSENESLELLWVTAADAGVYTLTVNTGNKSLRDDFIITVLTATTSLRTDLETVTPQGLTESADSSLTTSPTTGLSTLVNWTTSTPNANNVTIAAAEHVTSSAYATHTSVTPPPATHSDAYHLLNSTTSSHGSTGFRSTPETGSDEKRNESMPRTLQPEDIFSTRPEESSTFGNISQNSENPNAAPTLRAESTTAVSDNKVSVQSHLLSVLIIAPVLVLITAVGFFYRRQVIKKRMDLPPPFKPPPPPVKYTAVRHSETQPFPTSRCNSVIEPKHMTTNNYETIV